MDQWHALNHSLLSMPTNGRPRVYGRFKKCWTTKKRIQGKHYGHRHIYYKDILPKTHLSQHNKLRNNYNFSLSSSFFCVWPPCTMFTLCIYLVEMTWGKRPQTELLCDFLEGTKILFFFVHLAFISTTNRKQYRMKKIQNMKILC